MATGIDYGNGQTNIDRETGIRYGVIPHAAVGQAWYDDAEPDYGEPCCPKCGNPATETTDISDFNVNGDDVPEWFDDSRKHHCERCKYSISDDETYPESPLGYDYSGAEYLAQQSDEVDICVLKSPYYTRAAYCSPCAPGACYLLNPDPDGARAYCFGHEWFEDGRAPYPVYRVSDDTEVLPS